MSSWLSCESPCIDIIRYNQEKVSKGKDKETIAIPKLYKCIHSTDTSKEALFEAFEETQSQIIEFGEIGLRLRRPDPIIEYIVQAYGQARLDAPNYKNNRFGGKITIENPHLFFYADTTMQYLSKNTFFHHMKGGLINRCFLVHNTKIRDYKNLPSQYYIDQKQIGEWNEIAEKILEWSQKNCVYKINESFYNTALFKSYEKELHERHKSLIDGNSDFSHLWNRAIQNYRIIINILHLLDTFSSGISLLQNPEPSNVTIDKAINFCKRHFEHYDWFINEMTGANEQERLDDLETKVINQIKDLKLPCAMRDVYRRLNISKDKLSEVLIKNGCKFDSKKILSIPA